MHNSRYRIIGFVVILILVALVVWYVLVERSTVSTSELQGAGTVETVETIIASELPGRVKEVLVDEGEFVEIGQVLFLLEDEGLRPQYDRAEAALEAALAGQHAAEMTLSSAQNAVDQAQAAVEAAQIALDTAIQRHQQALAAARLADATRRSAAWDQTTPSEFDRPVWYFGQEEEINATRAEVEAASAALDQAEDNFQSVLEDEGGEDLVEAERRLAQAQVAFSIAQQVLDRAEAADDRENLQDQAQDLVEAAEDELNEAQADFDLLISEASAEQIRDARAALAVAQERYSAAKDELDQRLTGEHSLAVQLAELGTRQAEAGLAQAQAALRLAEAGIPESESRLSQAQALVAQAEADLHSQEIQLEKLVVRAKSPGVILVRNIQPGEVIQPGGIAMTLGRPEDLTITVYLPEDRYGLVELDDHAQVSVDSYPNNSFDATVVRIADQAEFTPRNVQTEEGRRTTVYAIELSVDDPEGLLKPGMPADVFFEE